MKFIRITGIFFVAVTSILFSQETQFGKNKVQYHDFHWYFIQSAHFDVYFTNGGENLATFTADVAEQAYASIAKTFRYQIKTRIPIIVYNSHNDFQQTNVISSYLEEGIGGVTELFKNRVVLPFEGEYRKFRHVIHHELVHAVINDMFYGGSIQSILTNNITLQLPLWFNEGLAEYEALEWDVNSDMFMRDAVVQEYLPEIDQLYGYFAYRGGQSVWYYIAERYGKEKIADILHHILGTRNVDMGFRSALGFSIDELSERWQKEQKKRYWPDVSLREEPQEHKTIRQLTDHKKDGNFYNMSPAISPQGDKLAFISDRSDYFDVYIMSTIDGEVKKKIISGQRTPDFEELHLLTPGMSWSPNGEILAVTTKSGEEDAIILFNIKENDEEKLTFGFDGIFSVEWSFDGTSLAFVGNKKQQSDIYAYHIATRELKNITNDIFSDSDPAWSNDGTKIFFSSDRNAYLNESQLPPNFKMQQFDFQQLDLYAYSFETNSVQRLTDTDYSDETSPVASPDGNQLLFISDRSGINNIYRMNLDSLTSVPITNSIGGIYQLSLTRDGEKLAFVSLNNAGFDIFLLRTPFHNSLRDSLPLTDFIKRKAQTIRKKTEQQISSPDSLAQSKNDTIRKYDNDVPMDFSKYVFRPSTEHIPQHRDTLFLVTDNKDSNDNYIVNEYKLSFSPDIIYGAAGYSTFYGVQGSTVMAFSDLLGDHQIFLQTNLIIDGLKNGDYALTYYYLPNRIDWGFHAYHSARFLALNNEYIDTRFRTYGVAVSALYPLSKFQRFDFSSTYFRVSRENLYFISPAQRRDILLPALSYVHDNVLWGYTGPNNGTRYNLSAYGTPKIGATGLQFLSTQADYRTYFRLTRGYVFAFRFSGGGSFGKNKQHFIVGGMDNWINRSFENDSLPINSPEDFLFLTSGAPLRGYKFNAQIGTRYALMNMEFRYPFLGYVVAGPLPVFFQSLTGVAFLDVGSAWSSERTYKAFGKNADGNVVTKDVLIGMGTGARIYLLGFLLKIDVAWQYDNQNFSIPKYYFSLGADF